MFEIVYVYLLDEDVDVWLRVRAERLSDTVYRLEADPFYNPESQCWQFPPGSKVVVERRVEYLLGSAEERLMAVRLAD